MVLKYREWFQHATERWLNELAGFEHVSNLAAHIKRETQRLSSTRALTLLRKCEGTSGFLNVNPLLCGDRIVSNYPFDLAFEVLATTAAARPSVFAANKPCPFQGEVSTATEWMSWYYVTLERRQLREWPEGSVYS